MKPNLKTLNTKIRNVVAGSEPAVILLEEIEGLKKELRRILDDHGRLETQSLESFIKEILGEK